MKNKLLSLFFFLAVSSVFSSLAEQKYRPLKDYAYMTYNILESYVKKNPNASVHDIRVYMRCDGLKVIIKDAQNMGYDRMVVIRCSYHIAMIQNDPEDRILQAIKQEIQGYRMWRDIAYWGGLSCSVFSTICCVPLLYMTTKMYQEYLRT